ncbi:hypothetical protein ACSAZL_09895 [Methanosarcina sp. T3]|uniref:hypothetical protein n=1 Tax=Methanosarcina sp. T3 TaxID=3439062 RepID=UPI003F84B167
MSYRSKDSSHQYFGSNNVNPDRAHISTHANRPKQTEKKYRNVWNQKLHMTGPG